MTKRTYCRACSNSNHGVKTPRSVPHTCGKSQDQIIEDKKRLESLLHIKTIIESGYAGVLPNGNIVDRREHPTAIPIQENSLFNTPKPKEI